MTSEAPELLPCPFCGGRRASVLPCNSGWVREHRIYPIVRCGDCYLDLPGKNDDFSEGGKSAVAAWNTRASQQALEEARAEGRRAGLEEAAKAVDEAGWYCIPPYEETGNLTEQIDHSLEAIRALIEKPGDAQKDGE